MVIAAVQVFFLLLLTFAARPFAVMQGSLPADGNGLNPLLQYPEMVIHPPMLYLGYVGFTVPFAFALGALAMRYPGERWIHITRHWTMVTWGFLTCGIFLGAHWGLLRAGMGWLLGMGSGGERFADAVAHRHRHSLHSVMMQEKRGMLKVWNLWLVFATFWLAILGTFLTRSGIISSVHAFAQSSIGGWFAWFLAITFESCSALSSSRTCRNCSDEHKLESLVSRESSFLFNNLLFVLLCFTVLWGTWFPKISELVQGNKVTVGAPFYNRVAIPLALLLLILTAVGPLLAWRKTSLESLKRNFMWPAIVAIAVAVLLVITPQTWGSPFGLKPWQDISYFYSLMAVTLSVLVTLTVASEFYRGGRVISKQTGQRIFASMVQLIHRNPRRYGGYIVHFGAVVVIIGFAKRGVQSGSRAGNGLRRQNDDRRLYARLPLLHRRRCAQLCQPVGRARRIYKRAKQIDTLTPERRFYKASRQSSTMPAIRSTVNEDLYLVFEEVESG